ncbi:lipase [Patiriisocius marinistellae]|uniref:Lipase n=1 Tax=Patiriisocius marinistellae TaxID=2494560 RepID=A0A5J4G229_9FLAO|nr:alpha/beta hydrolase [Patiriisocius marinistellae]GEQ86595.1 lipase [Patiriisocius marinistellae]
MKTTFYLFSFLILSSFISCNDDESINEIPQMMENSEPLEASFQQNVSYGNDSQQVYDLYLPANRTDEKTKVIILVHGGGWIEGDKADVTGYISLIQQNNPNHAIVNMNYRLAVIPTIPAFPNQFLDLKAVITKLTAERETLQILPEFGLIGLSAGAHISLQYDSVYDTNDQVKFVADIVGPSDFTDPFYADNPNFSTLLNFFTDESQYPPNTNFATALSPALQVSVRTSPTIMFYGNQDELVPLTNGDRLNAALEANSIEHQYTVYDGGHGNWNTIQFADVEAKLSAFIEAHLAID